MKHTSHIFIFWISLFLFFVCVLFVLLERTASFATEKIHTPSLVSSVLPHDTTSMVTRVVDGDTIEVEQNNEKEKIRLIGINAPESVDPRKPVECFGKEASMKLKTLLEGKKVELKEDGTQTNKDKYGRLLRYVYLDGVLVNLLMVQTGYAYEYTYNVPYTHQSEFRAAQKEAIEKAEGLWSSASCAGKK